MKNRNLLIFILLLSAFLRFYNLDWSEGIVWHPDERNMALAVERFYLPRNLFDIPKCLNKENVQCNSTKQNCFCNLNPHFFAYGGFPLYLSYILGIAIDAYPKNGAVIPAKTDKITINNYTAALSLRIISALSSTLAVLFTFLITSLMINKEAGYLSALTAALIPGLIQSAHFGTTESLITLYLLSISYFSLKYFTNKGVIYLLVCGFIFGISLATKISTIPLATAPMTVVLISFFSKNNKNVSGNVNPADKIKIFFTNLIFLTLLGAIFFVFASPYNWISFEEFKGIFYYDIPVALGKLPVFYTKQFIDTVPMIYQYQKILPYALGITLTIFGSLGLILMALKLILRRNGQEILKNAILLFSFLPFFFQNSFYYSKWTRYVVPTFPFFVVGAVYLIYNLPSRLKSSFSFLFLSSTMIQGVLFFSLYLKEDVRFTASRWIYKNIPSGSFILSETANVSDIPALPLKESPPSNYSLHQDIFNFYELDNSKSLQTQLIDILLKADYIFVPSRRVFKNLQRLSNLYPITNLYYESLFSGELGFKQTAEFQPFSGFPLFSSWFPFKDEDAEETFTVFDHPVIRIYKKNKSLSGDEYRHLLGISE